MGLSQFLFIKSRSLPVERIPWYVKKKNRLRYLWCHFPYTFRDVEVLGHPGVEVELPFTKEELAAFTEKELAHLLYLLQVDFQCPYLAVEKSLEEVFGLDMICDGKDLPVFMAEKILERIGQDKGICKKKMHIVLLDGDSSYTGFLLEILGRIFNYVTVVTGNESCYEEKVAKLYGEYGLAVSFFSWEGVRQSLFTAENTVFVDLTGEKKESCRIFPKEAVVLDLLGEKDIRYYLGKRADLKIYYGFSFGREEEVSSGLIQAVLGQESSWLRKGALEEYGQLVENLELRLISLTFCGE